MTTGPFNDKELRALEKYLESRIASVQDTIKAAYPSRAELLSLMDKINDRITSLEISKATLEGKASISQTYLSIAIAVVGLVIAVISLLTK